MSFLKINAWPGLEHGFLGRAFSPSRVSLEQLSTHFCHSFSVTRLVLLRQIHGTQALEVEPARVLQATGDLVVYGEGDALIIRARAAFGSDRIAFGIQSADCLPIICKGTSAVALVHAGWRGLAAGILEQILDWFDIHEPGQHLEVAIGPAAGMERYEVGNEVIEAFRDQVVSKRISDAKFLLSLAGTAELRIRTRRNVPIYSLGLCTISDTAFWSYRRDGARAGRNLSFVILGRPFVSE